MSNCNNSLSGEARFSYLLSMYQLGETKEILDQLEYIKPSKRGFHYKSLLFYGFVFNRLFSDFKDIDLERFSIWNARDDYDLFKKKVTSSYLDNKLKHELMNTHSEYLNSPSKNLILAGSLSLIPGLGQVYTENYQSALVAFILNTLLIFATVELFSNGLYYTGTSAALVLSITYIGNILNAVNSASQFNRSRSQNQLDSLQNTLIP